MCADNSSTALLDVPAGARIVAARLYVDTTLSPVGAARSGCASTARPTGFEYDELTSAADSASPKLCESTGAAVPRATPLRQAVWDVTDYVQRGGPGAYTVADIVFERAGRVPAVRVVGHRRRLRARPGRRRRRRCRPSSRPASRRAASRGSTGSSSRSDGATEVPVGGFEVPVGQPVFGKTFHLVAHAQHRGADNLLFGGQPLGNNVSPGDPPPPLGVAVGDEPACNTTTRILDDSICQLGKAVDDEGARRHGLPRGR